MKCYYLEGSGSKYCLNEKINDTCSHQDRPKECLSFEEEIEEPDWDTELEKRREQRENR